ncbi:MAG TPA: substrate-binding domain-containing protein [Burkholderiales bacterium]|nr:substrate-binding domain-containing protein [Burkholderiales bacterium]
MTRVARLVPRVVWQAADPAGAALDPRIVPLLQAIRREGTLRAAVATAGVSYRAAWGVLVDAGHALGAPLAVLKRGRGARLSPLGERLLAADAAAQSALQRAGADLALAPSRARASGVTRRLSLRVAASHDLALAALRDAWAHAGTLILEVETRGSIESLAALRRGEVALAGFHVAADGLGAREVLGRLDPGRFALLRFAIRRQGLIVPRGNPRRVRSLADVAAKHLRFVNRQRGSGTRVLVDQLLRAQAIDAASLRGYATEEFTHLAVAATIAAGKADAGFGLEAAARQFKLGFVPAADERYLFACRRSTLRQATMQRLRELLGDAATKRIVGRLAGYALDAPGTLAEIRDLRAG